MADFVPCDRLLQKAYIISSGSTERCLSNGNRLGHREVYITLERFENTASFLSLGLASIITRHENTALKNRCSKQKNLKMPALHLSVEEKHFENGAFRK